MAEDLEGQQLALLAIVSHNLAIQYKGSGVRQHGLARGVCVACRGRGQDRQTDESEHPRLVTTLSCAPLPPLSLHLSLHLSLFTSLSSPLSSLHFSLCFTSLTSPLSLHLPPLTSLASPLSLLHLSPFTSLLNSLSSATPSATRTSCLAT